MSSSFLGVDTFGFISASSNSGGGGGGGGSAVSYYMNGGTPQGTFGGVPYYEMNRNAVTDNPTNFIKSSDGYIAQFITDVADPSLLNIPAGSWDVQAYFSASLAGGNPSFYVELYIYDGTTFTIVSSSSTNPEVITGGSRIDLYLTSLSVPSTILNINDRLAMRFYVDTGGGGGGRSITMYTQGNRLAETFTTFTTGITAINGLTAQVQNLATGSSGVNFNIVSSINTHTFNLPTASAINRGALSSADWTIFNNKVPSTRTLTINGTTYDLSADRSWTIAAGITGSGVANQLTYWNGTGSVTGSSGLVYADSAGSVTLSKNQNASTFLLVSNTTSGTGATSVVAFTNNQGTGFGQIGLNSTLNSGTKIISGNDLFLYKTGAGDIALMADFSTSKIKFAAGAAGVAQMTLTSAGRLLLGTTTESTFILDAVGSDARINGAFIGRGLGNISTNTILGKDVLRINTTGSTNTSVGDESMYSNTTGSGNTAFGYNTLTFNTTGGFNVAVGRLAMRNSTTASNNTCVGASAGINVNGGNNTIIGQQAGASLTTGGGNTFVGDMAGFDITTGQNNIIIGRFQFASTLPNNINDNIIFGTSGIVKFRMFDTGNLILQNGGTFTDAGFRLDVNGTARVSGATTISAATSGASAYTLSVTDSNATLGTNIYMKFLSNAGTFFRQSISGMAVVTETTNNFFTFKNDGKFIVGEDYFFNPPSKATISVNSGTTNFDGLTIYDKNTLSATAQSTIGFYAAGGSGFGNKYGARIGCFFGSLYNAAGLTFSVDNGSGTMTELMRMLYTGNVLIGTTTDAGFRLDVNGTARVRGALVFNGNTGQAINSITQDSTNGLIIWGSGSTNNIIFADAAGDTRLRLLASNIWQYDAQIRFGNTGLVLGGPSTGPYINYDVTNGILIFGKTGGTFSDVSLGDRTGNFVACIKPGGSFFIGASSISHSPSAQLDVVSTTKGFLPPRMTTTQKNAIATPAAGLQVYDSTTNAPNYYDGTAWVAMAGGASIYTSNGTLTSNRTVSSGGFSLIFNPQTTYITTLTASVGGSSYSVLGSNNLSFASGFSSNNIGNVYSANGAINSQTFAGSATFAQANLASAMVSVNSIDFGSSGSTITMTQSTGIRAMTGHQSQIQYQGTNSGTITHVAISQNLGFYRPPSASGTLTITNAYSLLINDLNDYGSGFTFTNRWGIYQDGASDNNYFKGKVIIGSTDTVGASPLNVKNLPTSSSGLASGDVWNNGGVLNIV